jgi:hypothetical protein
VHEPRFAVYQRTNALLPHLTAFFLLLKDILSKLAVMGTYSKLPPTVSSATSIGVEAKKVTPHANSSQKKSFTHLSRKQAMRKRHESNPPPSLSARLLLTTDESVASDDTLVECRTEHGFIYEECSSNDAHPTEWKDDRRDFRSDPIHAMAQSPTHVYVMNESAPHARVSASDYMNNGFPDHKADLKHSYPAPSERHVLEEEIAGLKKEVIHTHSSRRVDRILEQIEKLTKKKKQLDLPEQSKRKATLTSANLGRDDQYDLRHE